MSINMNGDESDPFYRYKMTQVHINVQKTKTNFTNFDAIIKEIGRDQKQLTSFLNKYFATSWIYKDNCLSTTKIISKSDLQTSILEFIKQFVLCPNCKNPETVIGLNKKKKTFSCKACSFYSES